MQFALIGDHPDGLAMTQALAASGRYQLAVYAGPRRGNETLRQSGYAFDLSNDVEEVLARPEIELVIVADDLEHRPIVLRRAVQAEKHVLCIHPADLTPDVTYEAAMIQKDTRKVLLPLLAERLAPGMIYLQQLCQEGALGLLQVLEYERRLPAAPSLGWDQSPLVSLWDSLRYLSGELRDVSALAAGIDKLQPQDPVTLTGRFLNGGLFQVLLLTGSLEQSCRLIIRGTQGQAEFAAPKGLYGPARLTYQTAAGEGVKEWEAWSPWPVLVDIFQGALAGRPQPLSWLDGTRCLELFEAARRSAERGRVVPLLYEEFTETATFKGSMTSLGCLLLCLALLVFVAGVAFRWPLWVLYIVVFLLLLFLGLQLLRWIVPEEKAERSTRTERRSPK